MKNAKRMTVNFIGIIGLILYFPIPSLLPEKELIQEIAMTMNYGA